MSLCVLANTKNLTHEEWLKLRNEGIGGSDAAASVGLSKYKSAITLWLEKTGQIEPQDLSDNEAVQWGNILEDVIATEFSKRTGLKVRRCNFILTNPEYPFMLANIDRAIVGLNQGVEVKNVGYRTAHLWEAEEIPDTYYTQCQHYCAVVGWEGIHIVALLAGQKLIIKYIPRDDKFIEQLIEGERVFWDHVVNNTMPPADNSDDCNTALRNMHPNSNGMEIILPDTAELWIRQYEISKGEEATAKSRKQEAQNTLQQMLGNYEVGCVADRKVVWKTAKDNSRRFSVR